MDKSNLSSEKEGLTEALDEILEHAPAQEKEIVKGMMVSMQQMRMDASPASELMKKMTPEHITNYLDASREHMQKSYQDKNYQRIFQIVAAILAMVFVIIVIVLLKDSPDLLEKVLYAGGGVVIGAFGGYGYGKTKRDD